MPDGPGARRFVSEPIRPVSGGTVDAGALAAGEPSLPAAFRWRRREVGVAKVLGRGRGLRRESFSGETYLHRHEWRLRMTDGAVWEVYFERQGRRGADRWFLKTISEEPEGSR